jgi:hypothetical protein
VAVATAYDLASAFYDIFGGGSPDYPPNYWTKLFRVTRAHGGPHPVYTVHIGMAPGIVPGMGGFAVASAFHALWLLSPLSSSGDYGIGSGNPMALPPGVIPIGLNVTGRGASKSEKFLTCMGGLGRTTFVGELVAGLAGTYLCFKNKKRSGRKICTFAFFALLKAAGDMGRCVNEAGDTQ